jgi:hypothetical protein
MQCTPGLETRTVESGRTKIHRICDGCLAHLVRRSGGIVSRTERARQYVCGLLASGKFKIQHAPGEVALFREHRSVRANQLDERETAPGKRICLDTNSMEFAGRRRGNGTHRNSIDGKGEEGSVTCKYVAHPGGIANMFCGEGLPV